VVDPGLVADVSWRIDQNSLIQRESLSASEATKIRRLWFIVPTASDSYSTSIEGGIRSDVFDSSDGSLVVRLDESTWPFKTLVRATGNSALGRSPRGYIPLYLEFDANDVLLQPGKPMSWTLTVTTLPSQAPPSVLPNVKPNTYVLH
jgi:hypothetical protein